jgi:DNA-binding GntR family transcriptional regulator
MAASQVGGPQTMSPISTPLWPGSAGPPRWRRRRRLDRRLHGLVCAAARDPQLSSLSARLTAAATLGFGAEPYLQEFFDQAVAEHEELDGHVVRGEAHAANSTAQAHFSLTLETMKARLSQASARRPCDPDPLR